MTEENYNDRTSQALLRNQFLGTGKLQIPMTTKLSGVLGTGVEDVMQGIVEQNIGVDVLLSANKKKSCLQALSNR